MNGGCQPGVEPDHADHALAACAAAGNGHAHVEGVEQREFVVISVYQIRQAQQQALALEGFGLAPGAVKSLARGGYRQVDVGCVALSDMSQQVAGGWVGALKAAP